MFNRSISKSFKKLVSLCVLLISLSLLLTTTVIALDAANTGQTSLDAGKTVKGPGFYSGNIVQIDGTVDGSVFAAGQEIRVNGIINGDLITAAEEINISGTVKGNLYSAARIINISGQVEGDALGAAQEIRILKDAELGRDALMAANKIVQTGTIKRQFFAAAQNIVIDGQIRDDAILHVEKLEFTEKAVIGGSLAYSSSQKASTEKAQISGKTTWTEVAEKQGRSPRATPATNYGRQLIRLLIGLAGALLIWYLVKLWRPRLWSETSRQIGEQPLKTIGVGALALITTPILAIILMVTVVGIPLGIILALTYAVIIYLAKIIAAVFIGSLLAQKFSWPQLHKGVWLVLLGLCIIAVMTRIPLLGFLSWLAIVFAGLGSVILAFSKTDSPTITPEELG